MVPSSSGDILSVWCHRCRINTSKCVGRPLKEESELAAIRKWSTVPSHFQISLQWPLVFFFYSGAFRPSVLSPRRAAYRPIHPSAGSADERKITKLTELEEKRPKLISLRMRSVLAREANDESREKEGRRRQTKRGKSRGSSSEIPF